SKESSKPNYLKFAGLKLIQQQHYQLIQLVIEQVVPSLYLQSYIILFHGVSRFFSFYNRKFSYNFYHLQHHQLGLSVVMSMHK
ncbi:MAG: hypothetical protein JW902_00860, partial [Syntrophaceae bacterium]|nr:hypothetical protein [Syntrophaceae bacterium]